MNTEGFRDTEVRKDNVVGFVQKDVFQLDIAVDDAFVMQLFNGEYLQNSIVRSLTVDV